jgi:molybdopterin molybdotransferase
MRNAPAPSVDNCSSGSSGEVIAVDVAAAKAVSAVSAVSGSETVALLQAKGRVLADDLRAGLDLPPFDTSAMDGYVVRLGSFAGPGPWRIPVAGRIVAGENSSQTFGAAVRILTGSQVPTGFDAVIMQEKCRRDDDAIVIDERPRPGRNIRRAGEDITLGERLLESGDVLSPQKLALLAAQGYGGIAVIRRVRIGLISTGTELREPGDALMPGQIFNSNRVMLRAGLEACSWAEVIDFGIVPDNRDAIARTLADAASRCDAVITTGGVSASEEDHVSWAVDSSGGKLDVLKVAMRPGKPVKVGRLNDCLFLGLPGNPNAALVTFRMIALPALRKLAGMVETGPVWNSAIANFTYEKRLGRTEYVPVQRAGDNVGGKIQVTMLGRGSSASLRSLADAHGIAMLPPELTRIEREAVLQIEWLD